MNQKRGTRFMDKYIKFLIIAFSFIYVGNVFAQMGTETFRINGYSSFEFEKQLGDEGKGDPNGSFDADLFDLVFNIFATDRLRIAADLTWEHGAATEDGRGNVAVEYAFGEYLLKDWLKVRAGKMFTPFGIYNEIHTAKPAFLTVKEPLSTNKNNKFGSDMRFYPRWATGMAALGNFQVSNINADYILLVSNGDQEMTNPFEEDNNKQKSIAGRLRFNPLNNLNLGVSLYTDKLTELDTLGEDTGDRTSQISYGGQAEYTFMHAGLELEYVAGSLDMTEPDEKLSSYAYTAMVYYIINDFLTPYIRYEFLDPNSDLDDDEANQFIYGLNFKISEHLFLKGEINSVSSKMLNQRFNGVDYSEFKAAIAIGF
jgi:hypothetical protein